MLQFTSLAALQAPLRAQLFGERETCFKGVSTDTRRLHSGNLFVALCGERYDGHNFISQAAQRGAKALVVSQELETSLPFLLVADTTLALGRLASLNRLTWEGTMVAVTGSNGKTSVKELLASLLAAAGTEDAVLRTYANYNNIIGVALTLLELHKLHTHAVLELGTSGFGEIESSGNLVKPKVAIITNVGPAHLGGLGSLENVAAEKGSLLQTLVADGLAVVNGDDQFCTAWAASCRRSGRQLLKFGRGLDCDLRLVKLKENRDGMELDLAISTHLAAALSLTQQAALQTNWQVFLPLWGEHYAMNSLAAITAALLLGVSQEQIAAALHQIQSQAGRQQLVFNSTAAAAAGERVMLIDDTYNANPASMAAGLKSVISLPAAKGLRKLAVLGDMYDLGKLQRRAHRECGKLAAELGWDGILACGEFAKETITGYTEWTKSTNSQLGRAFASQTQLNKYLARLPLGGCLFWIKGSRAAQMENCVELLRARLLSQTNEEHRDFRVS